MALFNFRKKSEKKKAPACTFNCEYFSSEAPAIMNECCGEAVNCICCIKVLGADCPSCHQLYENAKKAVKNMGLSIEVEYIIDMTKVMEYGVMSVPALVVNESVVSMGKVLKAADIETRLHKLGY